MKKLLFGLVVACGVSVALSSCGSDKCMTCTYTDPATSTVITVPEVCGSSDVLDAQEAATALAAGFVGATDLSCPRN